MSSTSTPKEKKNCNLFKDLTLPVVFNQAEQLEKIVGYFNGFSVVVENPDQMKMIISKGYFGKANFSRCYPQFKKVHQTKILRERQFINRKKLFSKEKKVPEKVILVPDSDIEDNSDEQLYFTNFVTKYESDYSNLTESVWLCLEEAFFLCSVLNCLQISFNNKVLDDKNLWELFKNVQPNFIKNYVVYFYYRSKNYVVKPGIKFGGDFVLYKQGPPFHHSTFIVIIVEATSKFGNRVENLTDRTYDSNSILGLNRLCETAGKELLICRIIWPEPDDDSLISFENFSNMEIKEYLFKRWRASQER